MFMVSGVTKFVAVLLLSLPGDYNNDGQVNFQDWAIVSASGEWNSQCQLVCERWLDMADKTLQFDGMNMGYVTVPDDPALNFGSGNGSMSAWLFYTGAPTGDTFLFDKGASGPSYSLFLLSSGKAGLALYTAGAPKIATSIVLTPNTWYNIIGTFDRAGNAIVYANGVAGTPVSLATLTGSLDNTSYSLVFGQSNVPVSAILNGKLDDLRIYKSVLTYDEMAEIYNGGAGKKNAALASGKQASFAMDCDWLDGNGKLVDQVGGLLGTITGGVTLVDGGTPLWTLPPPPTYIPVTDQGGWGL